MKAVRKIPTETHPSPFPRHSPASHDRQAPPLSPQLCLNNNHTSWACSCLSIFSVSLQGRQGATDPFGMSGPRLRGRGGKPVQGVEGQTGGWSPSPFSQHSSPNRKAVSAQLVMGPGTWVQRMLGVQAAMKEANEAPTP